MRSATRGLIVGACLASAGLVASPARAQYFGQNKVQYRDFHYEVFKTEHFDIYFYPQERAAVEQAARMAERWYARYTKIFNHKLTGRQPLILYADPPDFQQTNAIQGDLGEGTGGVTEVAETPHRAAHGGLARRDRPRHRARARPRLPVRHHDASSASRGFAGAERLPLWFIEGMAEYLSIGPVDPNTAMWMRDAVKREQAAHGKGPQQLRQVLSLSLGSGRMGIRGGAMGRPGNSPIC